MTNKPYSYYVIRKEPLFVKDLDKYKKALGIAGFSIGLLGAGLYSLNKKVSSLSDEVDRLKTKVKEMGK